MGAYDVHGRPEMRLPKIRQLTEEQRRVYLYASADRHVLVQGPPGTGKTLIACLRAIELQKRQVPVVLGMFNNVLMQYSSNAGGDDAIPSQTVHTWFREWWDASGLPPHSGASERITVEVPYEEKDLAKGAGALWYKNEWRPWGKKKGVWMVDAEIYFRSPESFGKWPLWHKPPVIDGNGKRIDWSEVYAHVLGNDESITNEALNLGVLLIDEGQDFPSGFYEFLRLLSALGKGRKVLHPLRCFVLADENQQLTEENSTLHEIASALKVCKEDRYILLDNFRNSKDIAELARQFFADVGVMPRLPMRRSEKPVHEICSNRSVIVQRILTWLINNPLKEVGVLVFDEGARADMAARLTNAVQTVHGRNITVQTYSWASRQKNSAQDLIFDASDIVTVLNMQSCKGLEFDAVFIVDSQEAPIGLYGPDRYKMQMFVAVSRARDWVRLLDSGPRAGHGAYYEILPGEEYLTRESSCVPSEAGCMLVDSPLSVNDESLQVIDWFEEVVKLASKFNLLLVDNRPKGGAVWVKAVYELANFLEPLGFKYNADRGAWWRK